MNQQDLETVKNRVSNSVPLLFGVTMVHNVREKARWTYRALLKEHCVKAILQGLYSIVSLILFMIESMIAFSSGRRRCALGSILICPRHCASSFDT